MLSPVKKGFGNERRWPVGSVGRGVGGRGSGRGSWMTQGVEEVGVGVGEGELFEGNMEGHLGMGGHKESLQTY